MNEEQNLTMSELRKRPIRLIKRDNEIRLNKPEPLTLWDLLRLRQMAANPELEEIYDSSEKTPELAPERTEEKRRVLKEGLKKVEYALTAFENLEVETKDAGKSKEFEELKIKVIYPDPLGWAIQELEAWWKERAR